MMISEALAKELINIAEEKGFVFNITNPSNTYDMKYSVIAVKDIPKCFEIMLSKIKEEK